MIKTGQKLWFVPNYAQGFGKEREVTVGKVGRKWADIGAHRIDAETLRADGGHGTSPGQCWPNKTAWVAEQQRRELWGWFQQRLSHQPPDGVSTESIRQAMTLLGVDPDKANKS